MAAASRQRWGALLFLAPAIALGLWVRPHVLSLYHLGAGARALEQALEPTFSYRLAPEQVLDPAGLAAGTEHLQEALLWDAHNVQALRLLARAYLSQGQPEAALEALQQALVVRPHNPLLRLELGDVYDSLGWTEEAVRAYEAGGIGTRALPLVANYLKLTEAQLAWGSGEVAIALWRRVLDIDPHNLYALVHLARAYRDLDDARAAARYERRLQAFEPEGIDVPPAPRLAEYQGQALTALVDDGLWEQETLLNVVSYQVWQHADGLHGLMTERLLRTLLERRPDDVSILFYLAELYHRRGELPQAAAVYRQVVELDPDYAPAVLRLGMVAEASCAPEGTACAGLEEAAQWYQRYHDLVPDDVLGLTRLAEVAQVLDRPDATALRAELTAVSDQRVIVARMLGLPLGSVDLGANLADDGGFEEWVDGQPRRWRWGAWFDREPFNRASFFAAADALLRFDGERAVRVDGLWVERRDDLSPARAGFWHWDGVQASTPPITLADGAPYVVSLYYRTASADDSVAVWVSDDRAVLWAGDRHLPATGGAWHHFVAVGWNLAGGEAAIRPMIRSYAEGPVHFDDVEVRPIRWVGGGSLEAREPCFWLSGGDSG